ncbi:MAG: hypothetical protein Harvfovirus84_6, partial [Harvfovirus sp.]
MAATSSEVVTNTSGSADVIAEDVWETRKVAAHHAEKIRNISVVASVDHGKSSLTDTILERAGLISKAKA